MSQFLFHFRCKCQNCKTQNLSGALEHSCCMETCDIQAQRNAFPWRWNWKIGSVPFTQTSPTLLSTAGPSGTRTSLSQAYNLCFCSFFYLRIQLHNIAPHQCVSLPFFLAVSLDTENSLSAILFGSQQNDVTRSKTKEKVMCFLFT